MHHIQRRPTIKRISRFLTCNIYIGR
jgi:hypothetical protein